MRLLSRRSRDAGSSPARGPDAIGIGENSPEPFLFMIHSVYILFSPSSGRYYVGMSAHPERRHEFHNSKERGFTARYRPWKLVFIQWFAAKELARAAERRIKSWKSRTMIERLVAGKITL